jgi:hypothetical protein
VSAVVGFRPFASGLATGVALSAASSAMLEFHPRRDPNATGTMTAVMTLASCAVGILISSALVHAGTAPRVLPDAVMFVLFGGAAYLREPAACRRRLAP